MRTYFPNVIERQARSASTTVAAILIAALLAKLGHGWWSIAVMVALCLLAGMRNAEEATPSSPLRRAGEPGLGSKSLVPATS